MGNKRGQFFLLAAFVIIGIVVGLSVVSNSATVNEEDKAFYDLAEEIGFETKQVINFGVYNEQFEQDVLVEDFLVEYADYIAQERVLFVYGDNSDISALYFIYDDNAGGFSIEIGSFGPRIPIGGLLQEEAVVEYDSDGDGIPNRDDNDLDGDDFPNDGDVCLCHYSNVCGSFSVTLCDNGQTISVLESDAPSYLLEGASLGSCNGETLPCEDREGPPGVREGVIVKIRDINYGFPLKEGENFFLVIIKDEGDESFVAAR